MGNSTREIHTAALECLERAANYLESTQAEDGSWQETLSHETPIGSTCHLLPKLVLFRGEKTPAIAAAINLLVRTQEEDGSWAHQHTDYSCDAIRALLLTQSLISDERLSGVINRGVDWLIDHQNSDGLWGEYPNEATSLLMVCDVIDCLSKYQVFLQSLNLRTFWE